MPFVNTSYLWSFSTAALWEEGSPPHPLRYFIRAAILDNDGPIGQNTVRNRYLDTFQPQFVYLSEPASFWSGHLAYHTLPGTYPSTPMEFRVRMQVLPLSNYGRYLDEPEEHAQRRATWQFAWDYRDWIAYAMLVRAWVFVDEWGGVYKVQSASALPAYNSNHGTTSNVPVFDYDTSWDIFHYAEMARNASGRQITIRSNYLGGVYWSPLPVDMGNFQEANNIMDPAMLPGTSITLSGTSAQFPHLLPIPFPDFDYGPDSDFTMTRSRWELEFYVRDNNPFYDSALNKYYTVVYCNMGYVGSFNGVEKGGRCGPGLWIFAYKNPDGSGSPPEQITDVLSLHNRSHHRLMMANNNAVQRRSLFSLSGITSPRVFNNASRIMRVRENPRWNANCVLERRGTSSPYTFKVHIEDASSVQEVLTVTGKSALIEAADTRNEVLLIHQDSNDAIFAYRSLNGGWTWDSGTRCQLGGSNMSATALHDLDFSVRRGVYFLSATVSGSIKVLISENGVNWTDTGV